MQINHTCTEILQKAQSGRRITNQQALELWLHGDFHQIGETAHSLRLQKCDPQKAGYTIFRIINYTDICTIDCSFCSYMRPAGSEQGYVLSIDEILQKAALAWKNDCRQFFIQGGVNPEIKFSYYIDILKEVKSQFPECHIRAFSPVEVLHMSKATQKSVAEVFDLLCAAGLDSFPGAGAEILTDRMRTILSEKKASPQEWFGVMKDAFLKGLHGSTNIVWGSNEKPQELIEHLALIRKLQDETGGVLSFVPWTFQKQTSRFPVREVPAREYLKMVALSRIFLDNIDHIEVSLLTKGPQIGEIALLFGADDINSPVIEENVLRSYGLRSEKEAVEFIEKAGFQAIRRNFNFEYHKKS